LVQGEVAINITDKKVWVGNAATTPIQLLGGGADGNFTNISVSSVATFGAGTVSAPSITTTGDTNTGIFFPAADTIAFTEGGVESMRIDSGGNLCVGSTAGGNAGALNVSVGLAGTTVGGLQLWSTTNSTHYVNFGDGTTGTDTYRGYVGYAHGSDALLFGTSTAERMRIDSSGNVGIGTSSPQNKLSVDVALSDTKGLVLQYNGEAKGGILLNPSVGEVRMGSINSTGTYFTTFYTNNSERMRIDSAGSLLIGKTTTSSSTAGIRLVSIGVGEFVSSNDVQIVTNRLTNDGDLVSFRQDGTQEGTISVSGSTVSYNGGHLSRWSQLPDNSKDDTILKGTVLTNLDDMCVWEKDGIVADNEQLNKMKVSDVEGDTNVAGVFVNWTRDEDFNSDDMNVAMTGDMIIRIADGVVVQKGDLLMSAGDGTAKPQGDDIRRSKTVAKVTSNHITCTYADGSYCVPCVLMAC
jgi:hypothetical protein